jgi:hypothetical protein
VQDRISPEADARLQPEFAGIRVMAGCLIFEKICTSSLVDNWLDAFNARILTDLMITELGVDKAASSAAVFKRVTPMATTSQG